MSISGQLLRHLLPLGRLVPPTLAWRVGSALGATFAQLPGREQRRCRAHLARGYPEASTAWIARTSRRCFGHFGATALWLWSTMQQPPSRLGRRMPVEGRAHLAAMLAACRRGEGTLLVSGHIGNWELFARVLGCMTPLTVLGRSMHDPEHDAIVRQLRCQFGNRQLDQNAGMRALLRELAEGRLMATLPDQDVRRLAGCFVPWFGESAYTPTGPAAVAVLARVDVQPIFCYRRAGHWVVHFGPRIRPRSADRQQAIVELTARITAYQEQFVRRVPEQWAWWHRRWRTRPADRPDAAVWTGD